MNIGLQQQATITANALRNMANAFSAGNGFNLIRDLRDHADDLDRAVKEDERIYDK